MNTKEHNDYVVREIKVGNGEEDARVITQYHYTAWSVEGISCPTLFCLSPVHEAASECATSLLQLYRPDHGVPETTEGTTAMLLEARAASVPFVL